MLHEWRQSLAEHRRWYGIWVCLLAAAAGCTRGRGGASAEPMDIYDSRALAGIQFSIDADGKVVPVAPPAELVKVRWRVTRVSRPLLDSPSVGGDDTTAVLDLLPGERVPGSAQVRQIRLHYHNAVLQNPFTAGSDCVLLFTPSGQFYDWERDGVATTGRVIRVIGVDGGSSGSDGRAGDRQGSP